MSAGWTIREAEARDADAWCELRSAWWSEEGADAMSRETHAYFEAQERAIALLACADTGVGVGFAEGAPREDYVNGTEISPLGFLEGLYIAPEHRRRGAGRALAAAVERWVRAAGRSELAPDADFANRARHATHLAYGFDETERVVHFRKRL
ncbi:MAG: GNAT family N-acetyltransferase [Rudaea sp.]